MEVKEQQSVAEVKRFTGLIPYRVVALNPTLDELHKLGMDYLTQEPVYTNDKGLRLDFILSNPEGVTYEGGNSGPLTNKYSIFIENTDRTASTGSLRIINDLLQVTWSSGGLEGLMENAKMEWFSKGHNIRVAKVGEEELLVLFRVLCGLSMGSKDTQADEVKFNTSWNDILNGKLDELRGYIKQAYTKGNGVMFLQGIKVTDGGKVYTTLYSGHIQSSRNKGTKMFEKALSDYTPSNFDYQGTFNVKLYTGTPKPDLAEAVQKEDSW